MSGYVLKPIGIVRSSHKEASLTLKNQDLELDHETLAKQRIQGNLSDLIFEEEYRECLDGIEEFSYIMVIYWSHKISEEGSYVAKLHPAGEKEYPLVGVFATRSPARPNPLCITTAQLLERKENMLKVKGLDAVDGSPIIDIKPYNPVFDAPSDVKLSKWMEDLTNYFSRERDQK